MSARPARQPSPSQQPPPHPGVVALAKALARLMVAEEDRPTLTRQEQKP